ncbi:MAG: tetratricopeptide repeat protein [Terriglobales bacterium]
MTAQRTHLILLLVLTTCYGPLAWPQRSSTSQRSCEIRGQVRLSDARPATLGIAVTLEMRGGGGVAAQTQTDRAGKFEFMQVQPAVYEVHVRAVGYQAAYQEVDLSTIPTAYLNFVLTPDPTSSGPAVPPGGPGASISALDPNAPEGARKNLVDAQQLLSQGKDLDKSLELLRKAIKQYPKYSEAYLLIGVVYSSQKNWSEAEKALRKSVELNQSNAAVYVALGSVENEEKNFPEAEKSLLKAVELSPQSADAQAELARAYFGQGRWAEAEQQLAKANQLRPNDAQQHLMLGDVFLRERNAESALKEFQEALRLDPTGPMAEPTRQVIARIEQALQQPK